MAGNAIQGSIDLARRIRQRRNELGLTIAEAASRAGVGMKTWSRYEAGESIRCDKCKGVCRALNWLTLAEHDADEDVSFTEQEYRSHEAWSNGLEQGVGAGAALSFAVGYDILCDRLKDDIRELAALPRGTHIGEIDISRLEGRLPEQFLMYYDYNFLYRMKCAMEVVKSKAARGLPMTAHSVMEELIIYLCSEEAQTVLELQAECGGPEADDLGVPSDWVFDLFDDMDVVTYLYSDIYVEPDHPYHFSHWFEQQFFMGERDKTGK